MKNNTTIRVAAAVLLSAGIAPAFAQNTFPSTGNVGIGTLSPLLALQINTAATNNGIRIYQTGTTAAAMGLFNNSTGAHNYALFSTGSGNGEGAGHFGIYDYTAGDYRLFIQGTTGNVGIGTSSSAPGARLGVTTSIFSTTDTYNAGVFESDLYVDGVPTALKGTATNYTGPTQNLSRGVWGIAQTPVITGNFSSYNYGIHGQANGGHANYAGYFEATASGTARSAIGIFATYSATSGASGWGGYFNGSTYCTGTYQSSDRKLKNNIQPLGNAMDKLLLLKPSTYTYKTQEFANMNLPEGAQMGLIAQELETVFPELVREVTGFEQHDANGTVIGNVPTFKSVNYVGLVPLLIAAVQEQQRTIQEMSDAIRDLKNQQAANAFGSLSGYEQVKLFQNEPNPFNRETVIRYSLPQQIGTAYIAIYDLSGKQLLTVPLTEKGNASIIINSNSLSAGMFIYSIIADNKLIDSKRMVITE